MHKSAQTMLPLVKGGDAKVMKQKMISKNEHIMPTYFQIGRNSVEHGNAIYTHNLANRGLTNFQPGKRQNIPVPASVLNRGESSVNLGLGLGSGSRTDSPVGKFAANLRMQERKFKQQFDAMGADQQSETKDQSDYQSKMQSLLLKKQQEQDLKMK